MCSKIKCVHCGKWTWTGCGLHVEQALKGVKEEERCQGSYGGIFKICPEKK